MAIVKNNKQSSGIELLPTTLNLVLYKNDSLDVLFKLKDSEGNGVDLTGWQSNLKLKDSFGNKVADSQVFLNYQEDGMVRVFIADTSNMPIGDYFYELQLVDTNLRARTYLAGKITISGDSK